MPTTVNCGVVIKSRTYALREARGLTVHALAAPIARIIALAALAALGLSGEPFHDSFHARGLCAILILLR
jgi:hypothetical protein